MSKPINVEAQRVAKIIDDTECKDTKTHSLKLRFNTHYCRETPNFGSTFTRSIR